MSGRFQFWTEHQTYPVGAVFNMYRVWVDYAFKITTISSEMYCKQKRNFQSKWHKPKKQIFQVRIKPNIVGVLKYPLLLCLLEARIRVFIAQMSTKQKRLKTHLPLFLRD